MKRRQFLMAAVGMAITCAAHADTLPPEGLKLGDNGPLYQAGPSPELDLADSVTLEAWIKADPMSQPGGRILDKSNPGTSDAYCLDTYPGNSLRMITRKGSCSVNAHLSNDHYTHVVGVYSASTSVMQLFVDGKLAAQQADGPYPQMTFTQAPLVIGADPTGDNRFHGSILRAAIYGRVLTLAEIASHASGGPNSPSLPGAIGDWRFAANPGNKIMPIAGTLSLRAAGSDSNIQSSTAMPESLFSVWHQQPAKQWLEASPIGNGRLGAMVFGGVNSERLQLNEGTIWAGGPHDYDNPDGLAALPIIRQLIWDGKYGAAEAMVNDKFIGKPANQAAYQTVGDLVVTFPEQDSVADYRRELNLETAVASVSYVANGVRYRRDVFASHPDQIIVVRMTADKPESISFDATLTSPQRASVSEMDARTIGLAGISADWRDTPGAVKFQVLARAVLDRGTVSSKNGHLVVAKATSVTLFVSIGSSYKGYQDVSGDAGAIARGYIDPASNKPYESLKRYHLADYQPLFQRVSLDLGATDAVKSPVDQRIQSFKNGTDPNLAALHFQFGRYLLISCSRQHGQPATLQGLWNDSLNPPWQSKYTININTEMNYWPAAPANLVECYAPLFKMISEIAVTGAKTARVQYGSSGWVAHHNTDGWRGTAPVDSSGPGMWPCGGAWLCKSLWDHYEFTGDKAALRDSYALMKGAAQFFLDTLQTDPKHHWLVTNPSGSPEQPHPGGQITCAGPTIDSEILHDLFAACISASTILDIDPIFRKQLEDARARLSPLQIGSAGQLQEWMEDWDMQAPDLHNRHVSHLYAVFPSNQITRRGTPDLFAAAMKSLEIRGDEATGWGLAWRINLWARFEDGDHAFKLLTMLLTPERTAPNLFDLHPPFQIDGNFGATSGVAEMLLQSHAGEIHLLPALPTAWPNGRVTGLLARGAHRVDIHWTNGKMANAVLHALSTGTVNVRSAGRVDVKINGRQVPIERPKQDVVSFETEHGASYDIVPAQG